MRAIDLHGQGEHPLLCPGRGRHCLRPPRIGIEVVLRIARRPVDVHGALVALRAGDDIGRAIAIEVGEDGIFDRAGAADGDGRPGLGHLARPGVQAHAHRAALLPAGHNVHAVIAVDIGQAHPVRAALAGRGVGRVDDVARPGRSVVCECCGRRRPDHESQSAEQPHPV